METYTVEIRYTETYTVTVEAETPELAVDAADGMARSGQLPKPCGEWDAIILEGGE